MALLLLMLLSIKTSVFGRSPVLVTEVLSRGCLFLVVVVSLVPTQVRLDEPSCGHWLVSELAPKGRSGWALVMTVVMVQLDLSWKDMLFTITMLLLLLLLLLLLKWLWLWLLFRVAHGGRRRYEQRRAGGGCCGQVREWWQGTVWLVVNGPSQRHLVDSDGLVVVWVLKMVMVIGTNTLLHP